MLNQLFTALRRYLHKEKQFMMLTLAEKATVLLSMLIIVFVLIMLALAAIFFAFIATAHWLGDMLQNIALGYLSASGCLLLFAAIFYALRVTIVINPLARFMNNLVDDTKDEKQV